MPPSKTYRDELPCDALRYILREEDIEHGFIGKLQGLKYIHRPEIRDRASLEKNFREKFEALNRVTLTDAEFARLLDEMELVLDLLPRGCAHGKGRLKRGSHFLK